MYILYGIYVIFLAIFFIKFEYFIWSYSYLCNRPSVYRNYVLILEKYCLYFFLSLIRVTLLMETYHQIEELCDVSGGLHGPCSWKAHHRSSFFVVVWWEGLRKIGYCFQESMCFEPCTWNKEDCTNYSVSFWALAFPGTSKSHTTHPVEGWRNQKLGGQVCS